MARLRVGLIQLSVGDDAASNLPCTERAVREAAREGGDMLAFPDIANMSCAGAMLDAGAAKVNMVTLARVPSPIAGGWRERKGSEEQWRASGSA